MKLFGRDIGPGFPVMVVAEVGVNHNGDLGLAKEMIDFAAAAGADAVKFQTLNAANYISRFAPKANYQVRSTGEGESQVAMVRKYELSEAQHIEIIGHCQRRGIRFFSTAFEETGVDLLCRLGAECFKIPSGEITNLPLIEYIAGKGKPIILSTGMSSLGEVESAVDTILGVGRVELMLLHCVSNYPTRPEDVNLRAMDTLRRAFCLPVGYSDHTPGIEIPLAAVALGACLIEKHFTLSRSLPGPDHQASLEPDELKAMVAAIRSVERSLGNGIKRMTASEQNTREVARKSLVAARQLPAGTAVARDDLKIKRPGTGISPTELRYVLGRKLRREVQEDEPLSWEFLA
jgi:N-acetylneuraminate synthase